ncbi:GNAT family N-acetyltransferase [Leifsonia sp. Leaf264]|uniref:GNAT family N-acetyltransferase n=1 Tax=Leifsonia sp. Leaf264 TaxID=1736314 RepID=UPI000701CD03|nr:GNAT family N-acetyltransferase [Leifsonia sp. Leaf264]KQO99660.1 hypothetical protein ASF30_07040 [Leifsonia sp. Leaf264]
MVRFRDVPVTDEAAHALLAEYFAERAAGFPSAGGYRTTFPAPEQFVPPTGVFLLVVDDSATDAASDADTDADAASDADTIIGCGGIRRLQPSDGVEAVRYEVKHLYLRPSARGLGAGRALLTELEGRARAYGATEVVLDTNASLEAAGALYRRAGYVDVEPYNDNPNATNWYAKGL